MLKQLKFDCYKIFHSPVMLSVLAVCFALCLAWPISMNIGMNGSLYHYLLEQDENMLLPIAVILFTVFLVGMDFNSGYLKNIYTSTNRVAYIFSKIICVLVFVIVYLVLYLLLSMLCCVTFGSKIIYEKLHDSGHGYIAGDNFPIGLVYARLFTTGCIVFTYAMAVMFLLFVTKNQWVALVIGIVYYFVAPSLQGLADRAIIKIFGLKEEFTIEKFLILQFSYWNWALSEKLNWIPKYALGFCGIQVFYTLLAIGCSFLVFMKRKVKC